MNNDLKFDIGSLAQSPLGASEKYSFETSSTLEGIDAVSPISGEVVIMKIEDAFNVEIRNVKVEVEFNCSRSLEKYTEEITVPQAERQFYIDMPSEFDDINDIFLIDKKRLQLDITEMLRQEIILHFPAIPVCYEGSDELLKKYDKEELPENKPLAALKELLK